MNIKERREALVAIVNDAQNLLLELRKECPHPVGIYEYKSAGDFSDEKEYWKDMMCTDCGKRWLEDSLENGVRNDAYYTNPTEQWERK